MCLTYWHVRVPADAARHCDMSSKCKATWSCFRELASFGQIHGSLMGEERVR